MASTKHSNTMLKTAACTARLIEGTRNEEESLEGLDTVDLRDENDQKKDTYYADAWFGSVDAVLAAMDRQSHLVCVIKTNSNRYPKHYIESKMQDWPPGSHLLLEAMIDFKKVYALGYKYSKKKVLCFLFSEGAGHTEEGDPYIAKWKDENGNTIRKRVKRPDVVARYFQQSNKVDMHNHARQGELQLEKAWITTNGFFRVATTLFSLTVTDCWRAYRHHLHKRHRHKNIGIAEYASLLAKDLLENRMSRSIPDTERLNMNIQEPIVPNPPNLRRHHSPKHPNARTVRYRQGQLKEVPDSEPLTQDSFLMEIDLLQSEEERDRSGSSEDDGQDRKLPGTMHEQHCIVLNNEWTAEHKTRTYPDGKKRKLTTKRRKRGKCLYCGDRNTAYYCPTCPPGRQAKKHWVCGPPVDWNSKTTSSHIECQKLHKKAWMIRIQKEEDEKSDN